MERKWKKMNVFLILSLCCFTYVNCSFEKMVEQSILEQPPGAGKILLQSELEIETLYMPEECTTKAKNGDTVVLEFDAWMNDVEFETSKDNEEGPGEKLVFTIGKHVAIPGLEQGVRGMCVGEKRKLVVPPHLAFGAKGVPNLVPENAVAKFELELVEIVPKSWADWYIDMIQLACLISFVCGLFSLMFQKVMEKRKRKKKAVKHENADHED